MLASLAATAYENGRTAGRVFVFLLLAAVVYRYLVLPPLSRAVTAPVRRVIAVAGILVVVLVAVVTDGDNTEQAVAKVRTDMLAGCVDTAGEQARSYCSCFVEEVLERNGTSAEDLRRLDAEFRKADEGGAVPPLLADSVAACAKRSG